VSEYDNTNRGVLFAAKDRQSDKHPTHTGKVNVEGREYWLSAWVQESKAGTKYFSLAVKAKDEQPKDDRASNPAPAAVDSQFDDEIPF
jgi:hypothetical protein